MTPAVRKGLRGTTTCVSIFWHIWDRCGRAVVMPKQKCTSCASYITLAQFCSWHVLFKVFVAWKATGRRTALNDSQIGHSYQSMQRPVEGLLYATIEESHIVVLWYFLQGNVSSTCTG